MNKKAQMELGAFEIFYSLAFIFGAAIFLIILFFAWGRISTPLETAINDAMPTNDTTFNATIVNRTVDVGLIGFNALFPLIILGLIIFALISAYFSNSSPAFLFISIIILAVAILLAVVFSNVYQQIAVESEFQSAASHFNIISAFMQNLPVIITIIAAITIFALFALGRNKGATGTL